MSKLVISVNGFPNLVPTTKIHIFNRTSNDISLFKSDTTNKYGGLILDVPDGEYFVLKEASDNSKNTEIFDYVTTSVNYNSLTFEVTSYDSNWIYLKPRVISMGYSKPITVDSLNGEFRVNSGEWISSGYVTDGDLLEIRVISPVEGVLVMPQEFAIKVGPYPYIWKTFETEGNVISEQRTSTYRVQTLKVNPYQLEQRTSTYRVQTIKVNPYQLEQRTSLFKVQVIRKI